MTEQQPVPTPSFSISPKRAYTDLGINPNAPQPKQFVSYETNNLIIADVRQNVEELQAGVSLDALSTEFHLDLYAMPSMHGEYAFRRMFAPTLASLAVGLHWNLDRPEFVYMSGYIYQWAFGTVAKRYGDQIERRKETITPTPEAAAAKETSLAEMAAQQTKFATFASRLQKTLQAYAEQYLPQSPYYTDVLQELPFVATHPNMAPKKGTSRNRDMLYQALRQRDEQDFVTPEGIRQAHALLFPQSPTENQPSPNE